MPASACAPFDSTVRVMAFSPWMSATACIISMSLGPTYARTSPDATVEIITFGTPIGSARMAGAIMAVLPEPPAPMMPPMRWRRIQASKASVMPAIERPRSPVNTPLGPRG